MPKNRVTLNDLKAIDFEESTLYEKLYDISYGNIPHDPKIFDFYLNDKRDEIVGICLKIILVVEKRPDLIYEDLAIQIINDDDRDPELKSIAVLGLGSKYFGKRNKKIEEIIKRQFMTSGDDEQLKLECIFALLSMLGYSTREIIQRNGKFISELVHINRNLFASEFEELKITF